MNEFLPARSFTDKQAAFVENIVAGLDKRKAVLAAGYSENSAESALFQLLRQPLIMAAIQVGIAKRLAMGAPLALNVMLDLVSDPSMHPKLRLDAAKTILDRAGHIAPKAVAANQAGDVPLNEMSMTDLRALADKLEGEIAGRAKAVSSARAAPAKPQAIEDIM